MLTIYYPPTRKWIGSKYTDSKKVWVGQWSGETDDKLCLEKTPNFEPEIIESMNGFWWETRRSMFMNLIGKFMLNPPEVTIFDQ